MDRSHENRHSGRTSDACPAIEGALTVPAKTTSFRRSLLSINKRVQILTVLLLLTNTDG